MAPRWPAAGSQSTEGSGWGESTEGDLDPDLTEEAGYAWWAPPRRSWTPVLVKTGIALALLAILASVILPLL